MKHISYLLMLFPFLIFGQIKEVKQDTTDYDYIIVAGDSIAKSAINLEEVILLNKLKFDSRADRKRYLILRRKTIKVYPYAKLAAERLQTMQKRMDGIERNSLKKVYAKRVQKYIEEEFSEELKKLTRTEGQILVKLIHRQTGQTAFDLIKELRSGWRAFWFNSTANLFDISLKREFNPEIEKEDYLIEDILQRNFQSGVLENQEPAIYFDFYALSNKWLSNKNKP
ncbi:DUF4294 domain-containing protein [Lacinutrix sp. C3R15]|uniref:DUF4294 domain-containing protein n=1 Tax=Flavobacteriaceae TaxID=49546 RepID=UPI001C0A3F90|nr:MULTISPECIES: DUF4294 domain-containing protein [Flavobacteriaceae]MBU2940354.1 DUF4294 domain-containing protein [Lacinutrix sp. C3R15]MDO6623674.1 DUF4294 domain-containing protein [Oceanihabitans sp. 1_MG-2023]